MPETQMPETQLPHLASVLFSHSSNSSVRAIDSDQE
jgi:hypothetical protein